MVPMGETSRGLLALAIVLGVTAINLAGTDVMVKFNTLLAIISLAPTLVREPSAAAGGGRSAGGCAAAAARRGGGPAGGRCSHPLRRRG